VIRFWIIGLMFALAGLAGIRLKPDDGAVREL
jgi:hypothetical protein